MRVKAKRTKDTSDTQPETLHWKYKGSQQHLKQMNGKQIVIKSSIFFPLKSLMHISLGNSLQMIYKICEIQL